MELLQWEVDLGYFGKRTLELYYDLDGDGCVCLSHLLVEKMKSDWLPHINETLRRELIILAQGEANGN